jgi:hypothetical protein
MDPLAMTARFSEAKQVSIPFEQADRLFGSVMEQQLQAKPSIKSRALALAKTGLETGRWGAKGGLWNWNFGNIKAAPTYHGMYTLYKCNEILKDRGLVWFDPAGELAGRNGPIVGKVYPLPPLGAGHPQCRFRAYAGPTDGAYQYMDFVANGRYNDAYEELLEGDVVGYVHALKLKGYFTAKEDEYLRGVQGLFNEFIRRLEGQKNVVECDVPDALDVQACLAPQRHNAEATAMAFHASIESMYDLLDWARKDAHRQMATIQDDAPPEDSFPTEEPVTKDEGPNQS